MRTKKSNVAKEFTAPLPKLLRFFTALKIAAEIYRRKNRANAADILFILLNQEEYMGVHSAHVMAATGHSIGSEKVQLMREFFNEVYADEQLILDWLNGRINKYYFTQKQSLTKDRWENKNTFNAILEENGVFGLLDEFKI